MRRSIIVTDEDEDKKLRSEWTLMFLEQKGFNYILDVLMNKNITKLNTTTSAAAGNKSEFDETFELKHVAFLLKLLRIFLMAAFSTSNESQVYSVASLVRRSSSFHEEDQPNNANSQNPAIVEGSRFKEL